MCLNKKPEKDLALNWKLYYFWTAKKLNMEEFKSNILTFH